MRYASIIAAVIMTFAGLAMNGFTCAFAQDKAAHSVSTQPPAGSGQPAEAEGTGDKGQPESGQEAMTPEEQARGLYFKGMLMINHNRYDKAVEYLEESLKLEPENYNALMVLGKTYTRVGRHDDAIATLKRAASVEPSEAKAYDALTTLYLYLGRPDNALEVAEEAIKAGVDDKKLLDLGWIYYQLNRLDEAEARFKMELEQYGVSYGPLRNLGLVWFTRGDYEKALEYFLKSDKEAPDNVSLPYIMALTYRKLGKEDEAAAEVVRFKQRDSEIMMDMPKYNKLYFPHTDQGSVNDIIFGLRQQPLSREEIKDRKGTLDAE